MAINCSKNCTRNDGWYQNYGEKEYMNEEEDEKEREKIGGDYFGKIYIPSR